MHTGPRTNASMLNYTIGVWNKLFKFEGPIGHEKWVYHGELVDAKIAADLGDGVGAANDAYHKQYPGVPFPDSPDTPSAPDNYPLVMQPDYWGVTRRTGPWSEPGVEACGPLFTRSVSVYPIPIPANVGLGQELSLTIAEYGTTACFKQMSISREPGNFKTPLSISGNGNSVTASITIGKQAQPGERVYANVRFWVLDTNSPSIDTATSGITIGGAWPVP